jgi:hypothetical protein
MHTIRLRGPWEAEMLPGKRWRYSRRFHQPTGLGDERVWMVLSDDCQIAALNGQTLALADNRCDVTPQLVANNVLQVTTNERVATDGLARLEIGAMEA